MEDKGKLYTVTVLIALAGVLVSLIVSCFAGGIAGYWIGRRQARVVAEKLLQELQEREGIERPQLIVPPELFEEEFDHISFFLAVKHVKFLFYDFRVFSVD